MVSRIGCRKKAYPRKVRRRFVPKKLEIYIYIYINKRFAFNAICIHNLFEILFRNNFKIEGEFFLD